ncbi:MAG: phosphonoacetaldehyde reductase [Spirochaetaceae bacterium]|nr:phosphonoacetaldehyde reductase [Spirochaetaceae bacterium]
MKGKFFYLNNNVYIRKNCINILPELLKDYNNILLFTGKKSFENKKIMVLNFLNNSNVTVYSDFLNNPNNMDMNKAIEFLNRKKYEVILAVGGGSVIDFAKIFRYKSDSSIPLIAVPTTAGTGSEATKFAVFYINGEKHSIEDERILPNYAIIDSQFLFNSPPYLKACTGFDAFAQAIESFWSVNSNEESREYAMQSMVICKENLANYVNSNDETTAENMALAAHLSGKAINISKTTAPHAFSYFFTIKYGIPHGHAVALSFSNIFELNIHTSEKNLNDKRGIDFVISIMEELKKLFDKGYFQKLFKQIGLETNIARLGINGVAEAVNEVNLQRLKNNPRKFELEESYNLFSGR